jgi:superfamily I DNA and RNA helicase
MSLLFIKLRLNIVINAGAQYEGEKCNESAKVLSDTIRSRLKNLGFQRYKFIVQVVIGERREQGIR